MSNNYADMFKPSMSSTEARTIYWQMCEGQDESTKEAIKEAYAPVAKEIIRRELNYAREHQLMV